MYRYTILTPLVFLVALQANSNTILKERDYPEIKIKEDIRELVTGTYANESAAISPDGSTLCWIGKKSPKEYIYPTDVFTLDLTKDHSTPVKLKKLFPLNVFSKCAFSESNELVLSELSYRPGALIKTLIIRKKESDLDPIGFTPLIRIYDQQEKNNIEHLKSRDLNFENNKQWMKHPRLSKDGQWIAYYLEKGDVGLYLYNRVTDQNIRLSNQLDKHPTWSADNKKLYFHHEIKRKENILGLIGYYELELNKKRMLSSKRVLMDEIPAEDEYIYHKHPAEYATQGLLFFHGQKKPDGDKHLYVRKIAPGSTIYELDLKINDVKLDKAKHPTTSSGDHGVYFIGKYEKATEDEVRDYKLYHLSPKAIEKVISKMNIEEKNK